MKSKKGDWSVNAGNWNWVSCGDPEEIAENTSKICPVKNGKKVDPDGEFTRYVKHVNILIESYF